MKDSLFPVNYLLYLDWRVCIVSLVGWLEIYTSAHPAFLFCFYFSSSPTAAAKSSIEWRSLTASGPLDSLPRLQCRHPPLDIGVPLELQELRGVIELVEATDPREDGHVRDGVLVVADVFLVFQMIVQDADDPLGLHREPIDGVLDLQWGVVVKMAKAAPQVRRGSHLPHEPVHAFRLFVEVGGDEFLLLFARYSIMEPDSKTRRGSSATE